MRLILPMPFVGRLWRMNHFDRIPLGIESVFRCLDFQLRENARCTKVFLNTVSDGIDRLRFALASEILDPINRQAHFILIQQKRRAVGPTIVALQHQPDVAKNVIVAGQLNVRHAYTNDFKPYSSIRDNTSENVPIPASRSIASSLGFDLKIT